MNNYQWNFHTKQITKKIGLRTYTVNTINGNITGPAIHVRNRDQLKVNATNGIVGAQLSVHWHGFNMKNAQVFDGVVGLTQCAISPGKSFLYDWKVNEQPGTYWYHTHGNEVEASGQDFIRGPLIVHDEHSPLNSIPKSEYQFGTETILFYVDLFPNYNGWDFNVGSPDDESIEGHKIRTPGWTGGVLNGEHDPEFKVKNGEHTFRIINGGFKNPYFFSIDGYNLTVVATDGYPVKPYTTEVLQIGIAERYDVSVTFNIDTDTDVTWIRAMTPSKNQDKGMVSVLRIRKDDSILFSTGFPPNKDNKDMKEFMKNAWSILNCKFYKPPVEYNCRPVTELEPKIKWELSDKYEYHTVDIIGYFFLSIDNHTYTQNLIPKKAVIKKSTANDFNSHTNMLDLPHNKSVTIVIRNRVFDNHPMHLHGHHYSLRSS